MAVLLAGQQGFILVAAHLYNAALVHGLHPNDLRWADMEHFIEKHGLDGIFVGKRPEDGREILSHLALAIGLSPKTSAKHHRRQKDSKGKPRKPRPLKHLARYSEMGVEPYTHRTKPFSRLDSRATEDAAVMADWLAKDTLGLERSASLTYMQTLKAFRKAIHDDEHALDFDVLALHLRCFGLIRTIRIHCVASAPWEYSESLYQGRLMIDIVLDILMEYEGAGQRQKCMFPDAAKILQDFVVTEGSMCLDKAKAREEEMEDPQKALQDELCPNGEDPDEALDFIQVSLPYVGEYKSVEEKDGANAQVLP